MDKDPNPMAIGPTKWRADHCTTHHYACDCREWEFATRVAEYERDAERYRWLRERWGRISETYEAGTPTMTEIGDEPDGWDTDGESLDRCIDAAMAGANT